MDFYSTTHVERCYSRTIPKNNAYYYYIILLYAYYYDIKFSGKFTSLVIIDYNSIVRDQGYMENQCWDLRPKIHVFSETSSYIHLYVKEENSYKMKLNKLVVRVKANECLAWEVASRYNIEFRTYCMKWLKLVNSGVKSHIWPILRVYKSQRSRKF